MSETERKGPPVEVVSAIIVREGRILLAQRMPPRDFAFTFECPGGKVEDGESHHTALRRELREELGIELGPIANTSSWVGEFRNIVTRPDRAGVTVYMYFVESFTGDVVPKEGQGFGWFTAPEMANLHHAPANTRALQVLNRIVVASTAPARRAS